MFYRGLELDRFQQEAIEALQQDKSVLVAAPTGTGKTLVADWIVEEAMKNGETVIYTAPIKALSNQKFRDYCALFGSENVGLITGDLVIRRDAPCKVMTTEILRNILLSDESLDNLAAVIIDEIHFLDDEERGTTWEEVLIYLPRHVLIVGLSATLANLTDFAKWLSFVRDREVVVVEEHKRAVPLSFRVATREGKLTGINKTSTIFKRNIGHRKVHKKKGRRRNEPTRGKMTTHLNVFHMMGEEFRPYLYFVFSRAKTESLARSLGRSIQRPLLSAAEVRHVEDRIQAFLEQPNAESALDPSLISLYKQGIAFHHAGLHVMLKALVEELYEKKLIRVLYCTGTFALGINMPARSAVFDSLERYDGTRMIELPTREFMQMAGRAGRRGLDSEGLVVMRMNLEDFGGLEPRIREYLSHKYEPVYSRFSLSFNSVVNLLEQYPIDRIRQLVERSFKSWHRKRQAEGLQREATAMEKALRKAGIDENARGNLPKGVY
ncbi:MAG: DEAD/DEAH box helicase, partial [Myxococcota bacterium]|nr:DEAD/DEAH box helicase [Myxococcota bacterium]